MLGNELTNDTAEPTNPLYFMDASTPQLKVMVAHYQKLLPQVEFESLISDIRAAFEKYSNELALHSPGAPRARAAHRLMNESIKQSQNVKATCSKGCGACCHLEVEVTRDEGALLAEVVNDGFVIDRERLAKQAARERKSADWAALAVEANRCVFLGTDFACQIYESRPSICRKHVVASDPNECSKNEGKPTPILIPMAEIVMSAAMSQPQNSHSSLSKSLSLALASVREQ